MWVYYGIKIAQNVLDIIISNLVYIFAGTYFRKSIGGYTHLRLRTHGLEHSIFVTDTFILIPYALTWDSMMYHHCEKVPAALRVYYSVH